jgi:hypothetical protein
MAPASCYQFIEAIHVGVKARLILEDSRDGDQRVSAGQDRGLVTFNINPD